MNTFHFARPCEKPHFVHEKLQKPDDYSTNSNWITARSAKKRAILTWFDCDFDKPSKWLVCFIAIYNHVVLSIYKQLYPLLQTVVSMVVVIAIYNSITIYNYRVFQVQCLTGPFGDSYDPNQAFHKKGIPKMVGL